MITILNNNPQFTCKEGETVSIRFICKNNYDRVIDPTAVPSCGCTSVFVKQNIQPDEEFYVTAKFNSKERPGTNLKTIKLLVDEDQFKLTFKVEVQ